MNTVNHFGQVLLIVKVGELEYEALIAMSGGYQQLLIPTRTSGKATISRTKRKKMLMLSEWRKSSFGA
jgi:hypothetical protein